jgi:hypothetical protein
MGLSRSSPIARRLLLPACLVGVLLILAFVAASPASATLEPGMSVAKDQPMTRDFGPLAGNVGPGGSNACGCAPAQCDVVTYCDTVPLDVKVPPLGPNDDFLVRVTLTWDYQKVNGDSQNDLELRIYDKGKTVLLARHEGASEPEVALLYNPTAPPYHIVVTNATGVNRGYTLNVAMTVEGAGSFFEVGEESGPPQDLSGEPEATSEGSSTPPPALIPSSDLELAPIDADSALEGLSGQAGQLSRLLTPPSTVLTAQEQDTGPPAPVSGVQVVVWGGLLPAILIAAGFLWVRMKSPGRFEAADH